MSALELGRKPVLRVLRVSLVLLVKAVNRPIFGLFTRITSKTCFTCFTGFLPSSIDETNADNARLREAISKLIEKLQEIKVVVESVEILAREATVTQERGTPIGRHWERIAIR